MLLTLLLILAGVIALAALAVLGLVLVMRRPALAQRLMRFAIFRRVFAKVAQAGLKSARAKLEREAGPQAGAPMTDLEVMLAGQEGAEAAQAKQMIARMSPRQRQELSRMTMGADGLAGLMEAASADGSAEAVLEGLGRSERRRVQGMNGGNASREAQKRKQVAKRRQARKAGRRR